MLTDIEIAQQTKLIPIDQLAHEYGLSDDQFIPYGRDKAKVALDTSNPKGKLILVTATSGMPAGSGKTTTSIAVAQAFKKLGEKACLALREPSLGPSFGMKGGAAGGGYSQVVPMESINLHFTGDFHAITAANNLLAALIDNARHQGQVDLKEITWRRVLDVNDRMLRNIVTGLGGPANGIPTETGFDITAASELMAIICLAAGEEDLRVRLDRLVVGLKRDGSAYTCKELGATGALMALLKDAMLPNLVQSIEGVPAFVHGGPFANIAHGCNSAIATKLSLKLADYVITEAGFGADLGAEKFLDIKCRAAGLHPAAVVLVATVRALKSHGGVAKPDLSKPNAEAVKAGAVNLARHIENLQGFGLPVCVGINAFPTDTEEEMAVIYDVCAKAGVPCALSEVFAKGGEGGKALAETVLSILDDTAQVKYTYELDAPLTDKIDAVAKKIYRAGSVSYSAAAKKTLDELTALGYGNLPVCIAKTQYSFSDNAKLTGAPDGFTLNVREVRLSAGAGFVVVVCGSIMTMPGLPKHPAAIDIDVDVNGKITGLF